MEMIRIDPEIKNLMLTLSHPSLIRDWFGYEKDKSLALENVMASTIEKPNDSKYSQMTICEVLLTDQGTHMEWYNQRSLQFFHHPKYADWCAACVDLCKVIPTGERYEMACFLHKLATLCHNHGYSASSDSYQLYSFVLNTVGYGTISSPHVNYLLVLSFNEYFEANSVTPENFKSPIYMDFQNVIKYVLPAQIQVSDVESVPAELSPEAQNNRTQFILKELLVTVEVVQNQLNAFANKLRDLITSPEMD